MIITGFNPPLEDLEVTFLLTAEAAGVTTHNVKNTTSFATNDRILIGEQGTEAAEVVTITSVTDADTLVASATQFPHSADDPVIRLRFDQIKFYRSTTTSAGTFTLLATQNVDVNQEDFITPYDDTGGIATYYYKTSFYNSISTLESATSDPVLGGGYSRNSVGFIIDEIMRETSDDNIDRTQVLAWFNECSDDLQVRTKRPYRFLGARTTLTRTAGQNYINFPTDSTTGNQTMWKFERLDYNFTDSTTSPVTDIIYPIRVVSLPEFRQNYQDQTTSATTEDNETKIIALDETMNRFRIWPTPLTTGAGVYYLYYWKYFSELDSEGDIFETPNPRVYKLFAIARYYLARSAGDLGYMQIYQQWNQLYEAETVRLKKFDNRDQGSPFGFKYLPQTFKGNREF